LSFKPPSSDFLTGFSLGVLSTDLSNTTEVSADLDSIGLTFFKVTVGSLTVYATCALLSIFLSGMVIYFLMEILY